MTKEDAEDFSDIVGKGIDASWEELNETRESSEADERRYRRLKG
jgi:hypothetical protein